MHLLKGLATLGQADQKPDWRSWVTAAATAAALVGVVARFETSSPRLFGIVLVLLLGAITAVEIRTGLIADALTIPGIVASLTLSFLGFGISVADTLAGILLGGGVVFIIILASGCGIGGGVMKMAAMVGGFLGWKLVGLALVGTAIIAAPIAWLLIARGRRAAAPVELGPFLAASAMASFLWGADFLRWYSRP